MAAGASSTRDAPWRRKRTQPSPEVTEAQAGLLACPELYSPAASHIPCPGKPAFKHGMGPLGLSLSAHGCAQTPLPQEPTDSPATTVPPRSSLGCRTPSATALKARTAERQTLLHPKASPAATFNQYSRRTGVNKVSSRLTPPQELREAPGSEGRDRTPENLRAAPTALALNKAF